MSDRLVLGYAPAPVSTTAAAVVSPVAVVPSFAAGATTVVSTGATDAAGLGGARTVRVEGIIVDASSPTGFSEVSENVSMNGVTPVALVNAFRMVNRIVVTSAGATGDAVGTITALIGGATVAALGGGGSQFISQTAQFAPARRMRVDHFQGVAATAAGNVSFDVIIRGGSPSVFPVATGFAGSFGAYLEYEDRGREKPLIEPGQVLQVTAIGPAASPIFVAVGLSFLNDPQAVA